MSDTTDNLSQLRAQADKAGRLENDLAERDRKIAFLEAGIPYTSGAGALLFKAYDGALTAEAVTQAAREYGIVPTTSSEPPPATTEPNPEHVDQRRLLTTDATPGSVVPDRTTSDPYEVAQWNKRRGIQAGEDVDQLMAQGVAAVMGAAKLGDQRVLVQKQRGGYGDPRK